MTIRIKLIAAFVSITLIPILVITAFIASQAISREREQFGQSSLKQMHSVDNTFEVFLAGVLENVALLSNTPIIKSADSSLISYLESSPVARNAPCGCATMLATRPRYTRN
jgi:methyl-accepting chemotaxis protein